MSKFVPFDFGQLFCEPLYKIVKPIQKSHCMLTRVDESPIAPPSVKSTTTLGTVLRSPADDVSIEVRTYLSATAMSVEPDEKVSDEIADWTDATDE